MAVAILVIVVGLIVGVALELFLSRRQRARRAIVFEIDREMIEPSSPRLPQPRFIDDGEGFRILGPIDYDDHEPGGRVDPDGEPEDDAGRRPGGDR